MKNKVLSAIVALVLVSVCLLTVACSGKQTSVQNKTDLPTQSATEAPTQAVEKETPTATPELTEEPKPTLNPEPGAEPFDLPEYDYKYDKEKFDETVIFFPENKKGKTELNANHYDINPFAVRMVLPKGWTYQNYYDGDEPFTPMGIYNPNYDGITKVRSTLWFFDAEGKCVAAIGYEIFDESINSEEHPSVKAIYCMIAYGGYRFFVTDQYDVVSNPWNNETAITYAYYGDQYVPKELHDELTTEYSWENPAIVSYDLDAEVYIAMEFDYRYVDNDLVAEIAKSIQLISKGAE